jgi:predicted nucleotidyltransferase component of viral defense system
LLQEVVLDDILDRIAHSEYRDNLVLKGGFLIASLIGTDTRSTRDIDTSIVGRKLQEQVSHPAGEVAGQVRISIEGQDNGYALHALRIRAASI